MDNPITELRLALGLSRRDFALALGVGYNALNQLERGHPRRIPTGILSALEAAGHDAAQLDARYRAWREERRRELLAPAKPPAPARTTSLAEMLRRKNAAEREHAGGGSQGGQ